MKIKFNKKVLIIVIGVIVIMSLLGLGVLSSYREIKEEKCFTMEEINEIQVTMSSAPVHIIRTKASKEVKVQLHGKAKQEIKLAAEIDNKTVVVGAKRKYELPIPEDLFLDIYIPEEYGGNLSIKTSAGIVKLDSFNLASFILNTSSGGLEAEQLNAEKVSINTSSGKLKIKRLDVAELKIKGSSSEINIDECITKEARMEISSGSVTLKNSSGNFDLKGTAGDVLIAHKEFENQNINIETTAGNVTLELPETAEFLVEAKTSSGKFQSDFPINTTDKKDIKGQIGTKDNKISLKTSSGSINILKK
ncbi:DUF4097 family beta strand repeat-containing protein [Desulfosporosinus nitroreducens]|uniref:DUF4097 family beta strand repeat-containing protein n=1 Tax=Desulfosporosinus nitroreducens TaxID=2018668 RepID=UPI00207D03D3|nr:DUF4097 family beta strand repeat-containing protein [Desulfosporosinus nitroreducens]MCO1603790.1 DUF4097 domain-containing protein [Desulfosporosinus nitroreducens]